MIVSGNLDDLLVYLDEQNRWAENNTTPIQKGLTAGSWFEVSGDFPCIGCIHSFAEERDKGPEIAPLCKVFSPYQPLGALEGVYRSKMQPITPERAAAIYMTMTGSKRLPDFPVWTWDGTKYDNWSLAPANQ